jgi:hypothetical protein
MVFILALSGLSAIYRDYNVPDVLEKESSNSPAHITNGPLKAQSKIGVWKIEH